MYNVHRRKCDALESNCCWYPPYPFRAMIRGIYLPRGDCLGGDLNAKMLLGLIIDKEEKCFFRSVCYNNNNIFNKKGWERLEREGGRCCFAVVLCVGGRGGGVQEGNNKRDDSDLEQLLLVGVDIKGCSGGAGYSPY